LDFKIDDMDIPYSLAVSIINDGAILAWFAVQCHRLSCGKADLSDRL